MFNFKSQPNNRLDDVANDLQQESLVSSSHKEIE